MNRATWLIPVLSAVYWGSCRTDAGCRMAVGGPPGMSDERAAICGLCLALALLLVIRQFVAWADEADSRR